MSDDKFTRIENKLDLLDSRLDQINVTLVQQHATLEEHQRRSLASEARLEVIETELKPVTNHVAAFKIMTRGIVGTITVISLIIGIAVGLRHLGVL